MRKRVPLITLTTGTVVLETIVIWTVGAQSSLALAPQVSAPAPYGVFHDIRWLLVYHESWLGFVLELIALLLFRTALTTALVVLASCGGLTTPVDIGPPPNPGTTPGTYTFTVGGAFSQGGVPQAQTTVTVTIQ